MYQLKPHQLRSLQSASAGQTPSRLQQALQKKGFAATLSPDKQTLTVKPDDKQPPIFDLNFSSAGSPSDVVLAAGSRYQLLLDGSERLTGIRYPCGDLLHWSGEGDLPQTFGRPEAAFHLEYDAQGHPLSICDPLGQKTLQSFNAEGRLLTRTDRLGNTVRYDYDDPAQLRRIDPLGRVLTIELGEVSDPHSTRLNAITFPDGSQERFEGDAQSRQRWLTRRDGSVIRFGASPEDKITSVEYGAGWHILVEHQKEQIAAIERRTPTHRTRVTFQYNEQGFVTQEEGPWGKVSACYDELGRCSRLEGPHGFKLDFQYDPEGRPSVVTTHTHEKVTWAYSPTEVQRLFSNGMQELWQMLPSGPGLPLRQRQTLQKGSLPLALLEYDFDALERLSQRFEVWGPGSSHRSRLGLEYDAEHRLTGVQDLERESARLEHYAYDAVGNMVQDGRVNRRYDALDALATLNEEPLHWSSLGHLTAWRDQHGAHTLEYGPDNTIQSVTNEAEEWRGVYDGLGRRILWSNGRSTWRFGWWGHQLIWESYQADPESPWQTRSYFWLPEGLQPFGFVEDDQTYWLIQDARGATIRVVDGQGQIAWRGHYDSFGQVTHEMARIRQPWRLAGMYEDEGSRLYFTLARAYSPILKTWLSPDPHWSASDTTFYSYARQDPWNRVDPTGQLAPLIAAGIGAVVGGVIGAGVALATGGDPIAGAVGGAVSGAASVVVGTMALAGALSAGAAIALGVAASALGAAAEEVTRQLRDPEPWCFKCLLSSVVASVLTDLALLGLGKIPGVKALAKAAGEAFEHFARKIPLVRRFLTSGAESASPAASKATNQAARQVTKSLAKPTSASDQAALEVTDVLNRIGNKSQKGQTIGAIEDSQGNIWIAVSGKEKDAAKLREKLMSDPALKDKPYRWASDEVDTSHFDDIAPVTNTQGDLIKQGKSGADNNCVEAKLYATQSSSDDIKGMTVIRGEGGPNLYPTKRAATDSQFAQELCPCSSCQQNLDNILNMTQSTKE